MCFCRPRTQNIVTETPSYEFQARYKPVKIKTEPQTYKVLLPLITNLSEEDDNHSCKRRKSSPEQKVAVPSPEGAIEDTLKNTPCEHQRLSIVSAIQEKEQQWKTIMNQTESKIPTDKTSWEEHLSRVPVVKYDWGINPYNIDQQATKHYVEMFLIHGDAATQWLFPRKAIIRWLEGSPEGSRDDLMLIYAILALGTVFSIRQNHKSDGELFADTARYAIDKNQSRYSLQLVQSRLLLGLYYFATGDSQSGWDFSGQGFRAALGLKLNVEEHCQDISHEEDDLLGLRRHALVECRRRTYWLAYIIDRLGDFHEDHAYMLQSQDTFLRLPCTEMLYSLSGPSKAPCLKSDHQHSDIHQTYEASALGPMAHLVEISTIWGDVSTYIYRHSRNTATEEDSLNFESHYRSILKRLSTWQESLPKDLINTPANLSLTTQHHTLSTLLSLHTLYHTTLMRLNRHSPPQSPPSFSNNRNHHAARTHATDLLDLIATLTTATRLPHRPLPPSASFLTSFPPESCPPLAGIPAFTAYAILLAIDILTAGGSTAPESLAPLLQSMTTAFAVVDEMAGCWKSVGGMRDIILARLEGLEKDGKVERGGFWRCRKALDRGVEGKVWDICYTGAVDAFEDDGFFKMLGEDVEEARVVYLD